MLKRMALATTMAMLLLGAGLPVARAGTIWGATNAAAGDLVVHQQAAGDWLESGYTGESVTGLTWALGITQYASYRTAAQDGGNYCLNNEGGYNPVTHTYDPGPYAGGVYAMTRLSEISANPASNTWRTAVADYFSQVRAGPGTQNFINDYLTYSEASSAVYDIARNTVAAYYVNAADKAIWRKGLETALGNIGNANSAPVMALGAAVWGLGRTGPLDGTMVTTNGTSFFTNTTLSQLPGMLAANQAPDGSFYTKFNHGLGSGFTETTVMGTLGLLAAGNPSTYGANIASARLVLANGVSPTGKVYWKIGDSGYWSSYYLEGEFLEAMPTPGDANMDGVVDMSDYVVWFTNFGRYDASVSWQTGDFNGDGSVDMSDYVAWFSHFGDTGFGGSVPEPTTLALLALGGFAMVVRRRRK